MRVLVMPLQSQVGIASQTHLTRLRKEPLGTAMAHVLGCMVRAMVRTEALGWSFVVVAEERDERQVASFGYQGGEGAVATAIGGHNRPMGAPIGP